MVTSKRRRTSRQEVHLPPKCCCYRFQFLWLVILLSLLLLQAVLLVEAFIPGMTSRYQNQGNAPSTTKLYLDGKGMAGQQVFNKHLLGDVIRALQPRYLNQAVESLKGNIKGATKIDLSNINIEGLMTSAPSWEELQSMLQKQQTPSERQFRQMLDEGKVSSPLATKRLFHSDKTPRVTLWRDSASWCPYCQKVWIALEELEISYEIRKVAMNCYASGSKPEEFLKVQPSGNLPCVIVKEGQYNNNEQPIILSESDDILNVLDEMSTTSKMITTLRPPGKEELITQLCDDGPYNSLERKAYREWLWYLTGKRKPLEYRERFEYQLDCIEEALGEDTSGPYFLGSSPTLPDIKFIPFVERMVATIAYYKGWDIRTEGRERWPLLNKWLEAMESRLSYKVTKSDYYTHSRALPPQLGAGCYAEEIPEANQMRRQIDALHLSTTKVIELEQGSVDIFQWTEPGWTTTTRTDAQQQYDRREAAERVIYNHVNIVKFACRGAGTPGFPVASAELSDPCAVSNMNAQPLVDTMMRHVVYELLTSTNKSRSKSNDNNKRLNDSISLLRTTTRNEDTTSTLILATIDCLDYIRARIGVPRDMSYLAATELRQSLLNISKQLLLSLEGNSSSRTPPSSLPSSQTQLQES